MSGFRTFLQDEILDHLFGKGVYSPPSIYVALIGVAEISGNGYARVSTVPADWTVSSGGAISNASEIAFPVATGDWGVVAEVALYDAPSGGNQLVKGLSNPPQVVATGKVFTIAIGDADLILD